MGPDYAYKECAEIAFGKAVAFICIHEKLSKKGRSYQNSYDIIYCDRSIQTKTSLFKAYTLVGCTSLLNLGSRPCLNLTK